MNLAISFIKEKYKHIAYLKQTEQYVVETVQNDSGKIYVRKMVKGAYSFYSNLNASGLRIYPRIYFLGNSDGDACVIEEYLTGETLDDIFSEGREIDRHELRKLVYNLLKTVLLLHAQGLYHGKLKLSNIVMLNDNEHMQLIDFQGSFRKYLCEAKQQQDVRDCLNIAAFLAQSYDDIFLQSLIKDYLAKEVIKGSPLSELCSKLALWSKEKAGNNSHV